jgi:outer membrane protein OmpA-like peptidoglycan-associated protein
MNIKTLTAALTASILLVACAGTPVKPPGAVEARNKLTQLQSDPNLSSRAAVAIKDAETAVTAAEQSQANDEQVAHLVYIAQRKVDTAIAQAETAYAEDQRATLTQQREKARLDARTREADIARGKEAMALAESARQKQATDRARADAAMASASADAAAMSAEAQAAQMQRQIDELQAKTTDRGLVLTLGDVLFESGKSELRGAALGNLDKLATFLVKYPGRMAAIEGYTDSVGTDDFNQGLSQRRADSVMSYLVRRGVGQERLRSSGLGESSPVAGNDSAHGRQQNRRVEIIINEQPVASR